MKTDPRYISGLIVAGMLALAAWCDGEDSRPEAPAYTPDDTAQECPDGRPYTAWCGCDTHIYGDDC